MSFHKSVCDMLARHGSDVSVQTGDTTAKTKAFIQPLRYKSQYSSKISFGGNYSENYFLYIGSADCVLCARTPSIVTQNDKKYVVHNTQNYVYKNKTLYVWAVLSPFVEKRRDDYGTNQ